MRFVPSVMAVVWAAFIFALSASSNPPGSSGSEWQANLAHFTLYGILAVLISWAFRRAAPGASTRAIVASAWIACVAYACSDEYHQSFVAGRDASIADLGFDAAGAAIALLFIVVAIHKARGDDASAPSGHGQQAG